jgi:glucose dehydrogenase
LWETRIPAVQSGPPMTYLHDGRQYVAFTAGDQDGGIPGRLIAFALPARP